MTYFIDSARIELDNLIRLRDDLMKDPARADRIVITTKREKDKLFYYRVTTKNRKRTRIYLGDSQSPDLRKFARSSYKHALIKVVDHDISVLNALIAEYESYESHAILASLSPSLTNVPFDKEFSTVMKELWAWARADYEKNSRPFGEKVIRAADGTRVRSKSECIIYNILMDMGIPFRYDPVLKLKRRNLNDTVDEFYESPDFQILCPDGSFILIEHAGMLSSMQYAATLANKLQTYQLSGYILGYSLFVTSDDVYNGIDSESIARMLKSIRARFPYL